MTNPNDTYTSPLAARNASPEMLRIWSPRHKFNTWRRIWLAVAEAQQACGLEISDEQIADLRGVVERGITDEELARAAELERDLRHDVMAHVHCLGEQAPKAKGIVHLGMTSQDVVCNADLMTVGRAASLIESKMARLLLGIADFSRTWEALPTLGFTHYQVAQPTTVGRRAAGWAADLDVAHRSTPTLFLRGFRGATGTQASFLALFGSAEVVDRFEAEAVGRLLRAQGDYCATIEDNVQLIRNRGERLRVQRAQRGNADDAGGQAPSESEAEERAIGLTLSTHTYALTGQTYPRAVDTHVLASLASIASVLHKIATDIRLLSNRKEIDEPFGDKQIGSSAMPYKRNPMKCERICGLTRFVMNLVGNAYDTAATQWLERTLDDSSNRRLSLPEAFLALDGALDLMHQVASGLVVHEAMVRKNLMAELPFLATENILMAAVKAGADRQDYHEKIRAHAQAAGMRVKQEGLDNDLLDRLQADPAFHPPALKHELDWDGLMDPMKYIGRSIEQTERFLTEVVEPLREQYADEIANLGASDRGV